MTTYNPFTPEGRAQLRKLAGAATPGPWKFSHRDYPDVVTSPHGCLWYPPSGRNPAGTINNHADAEFIAASREALPAALDCIEEQQRRIEELEAPADLVDSLTALWAACVERTHRIRLRIRLSKVYQQIAPYLDAENISLLEIVADQQQKLDALRAELDSAQRAVEQERAADPPTAQTHL